jgi:hypothetical protein
MCQGPRSEDSPHNHPKSIVPIVLKTSWRFPCAFLPFIFVYPFWLKDHNRNNIGLDFREDPVSTNDKSRSADL